MHSNCNLQLLALWIVWAVGTAAAKAFVVLENVAKRITATVVVKELQRIGYLCTAVFANSASFSVPQSRSRVYIFGAHPQKVNVQFGPLQWVRWLQDKTWAGWGPVIFFSLNFEALVTLVWGHCWKLVWYHGKGDVQKVTVRATVTVTLKSDGKGNNIISSWPSDPCVFQILPGKR